MPLDHWHNVFYTVLCLSRTNTVQYIHFNSAMRDHTPSGKVTSLYIQLEAGGFTLQMVTRFYVWQWAIGFSRKQDTCCSGGITAIGWPVKYLFSRFSPPKIYTCTFKILILWNVHLLSSFHIVYPHFISLRCYKISIKIKNSGYCQCIRPVAQAYGPVTYSVSQ